MATAWTILRRLRTGLMLAATLALVLHAAVPSDADANTSAPPGHGQGSAPDPTHRLAAHPHDAHAGTEMAVEGHAARHVEPADRDHGPLPCRSACCGTACSLAVLIAPVQTARRAIGAAWVLPPRQDAMREGFDPPGLKRPPNASVAL